AASRQLDHQGGKGGKLLGYLGMVAAVLLFFVPLYFIVITSLKTHGDIYSDPITWIPNPFAPDNYTYVLEEVRFDRYLRNSLIITSILTVVEVSLGVMCAYGVSFLRFPGRNLLFLLGIGWLVVPNQVTALSDYAVVATWGWRNTL